MIMVKLKDIADTCGVSVATVSRALNGLSGAHSEKTEMIRHIAEEMGYFPNAAANALKTNRSFNIGILYEDRMNHEYFSILLDALRDAAERHGYDLTFILRGTETGNKNYYEHARRRNMDGVIVIQADFSSAEVIRLATSTIPTVVIDHEYEGCDCILNDNRQSLEQIVASVYEKGHRHIAYIQGEDGSVTRNRTAGFYKGCAEHGLRVPAEYVQQGHFHQPDSCEMPIRLLMSLPLPPTCILLPDDYSSLKAIQVLNKLGLRVPEDVSLVGYDGIGITQMLKPRLTTYSQDAEKIGAEAIELLLEAIEKPEEHKPRHVFVTGSMIDGDTVRNL